MTAQKRKQTQKPRQEVIQEEGFHGQKTHRIFKKKKRKGAGFASAMDKERGHLDRVSQQLSLRSAEPTPGSFPFTFASPSSHAMETYFF